MHGETVKHAASPQRSFLQSAVTCPP